MRELSLNNSRLDKRYDIVEELGRGSYAEIFVAKDTLSSPQSPHHLVVIKALNVFLQNDLDPDLERTLVENFQNEAVALDRVRHPNIISRLGHGTARDLKGTVFHYLVLEYLAGGDLQKACREKTLTPKVAFEYIEQTCAGLRHAHRHGIIHRDIKPQNLLLSADKQTVKIADFGVARIHQSDAPITRVGTNIYAPPEHSPLATGDGVMTVAALTPAADIYSLAKTVYTLLTGETPRFFANQPIIELPMSVRNEEWADELKRVLNRATLNLPEMRHQSIDEFWTDLEKVRSIILEAGTTTSVRPKLHEVPQAHVALGYSPIAPREPKFDTTTDLRKRHPLVASVRERGSFAEQPESPAVGQPAAPIESYRPPLPLPQPNVPETPAVENYVVPPKPVHKPGRLRRLALIAAGLVAFSGLLYGTAEYLRGVKLFPGFSAAVSSARMGTANTDINLRPGPSPNNEPIGLVTKGSRVKILKSQGRWQQVEIVTQGRDVPEDVNVSSEGWLYGDYVDIDNQ